MKHLLLSTTAFFSFAAAGHAQQAFDWNGWYFGGQVGLTQHQATYEEPDYDWYGHTMDFNSLGGSLGAQVGYNRVQNNRLVGIEADFSFLTNSETSIYASDDNIPNSAKSLATLRARTGLAIDNTMVFVTGGLAFANFDRSWTEFNDVSDSWPDLGDSKVGVSLGFGIEHAINDKWSVAGMYTANIFGENTSINADSYPLRINDDIHRVSLAFNYNFGGGADGTSGGASTGGTPADFSGAYVGALLGLGAGAVAQSDIDYDYYGGSYDVGNAGGVAGLTAGYNWQDGAAVYGIEAQIATTSLSEAYTTDFGDIDTGIDSYASIRGRAGVVAGNTLMYVLGGVTVANVTNQYVSEEDVSGSYMGLTVGAGVEQSISDTLSWNVEAAYTLFDGDDDPNGNLYHGSADMLTVTAGLNYHFGGDDRAMGTGALAPTHDWAGSYYGFDVALLANQATVTDVDYYEYGGSFDVNSLGAGVGAHIGHNWQNGSFVYGVVADVAAFSNSETRTSPGYREVASAVKAMATVRGRAGIATGNSLFYLTGGVALTKSDLNHAYLPAPNANSFEMSDTRVGLVVGMGMEHAMSKNSSIKVEALFTKSAESSYYNGADCSGPVGFDGGVCNMDGSDVGVLIKVGYSWSF